MAHMTLQAVKSQVGVRELHDQLSRYVQHVSEGNEVLVTMRGRPVARLTPVDAHDPFEDLRRRGILQDPTQEWVPRGDGPIPTEAVADLIVEQRR
jgi:prevent-host-death family protein